MSEATDLKGWNDGVDAILYQSCGACRHLWYFRRGFCPSCGDASPQTHKASGNGVVYACSVIMGKPGTDSDYAVVLVDLQEGVRLMSHVVDCDQHTVTIGMPVSARIIEKEGKPLVVFAPAHASRNGGPQ